jgi:hypothetical protein
MASSGMTVLPSLSIGVTSTDSHLTGTFPASVSAYRRERGGPYVGRRVDVLDRLRDFRPDAVALDQRDGEFALASFLLSACVFFPTSSRVHRGAVIEAYIVALGALELGDLVFGGDGVRSRLGLYLYAMLAIAGPAPQLKLYHGCH